MALTVEDGTGLANADAYVSVAFVDAYVASYEPENASSWTAAATADKEVAIRRATQWLDVTHALRWLGTRIDADMALDWPRSGVVSEGALLAEDELPSRLEEACAEAAVLFAAGEVLTEDLDTQGGASVDSESKELGPLKTRTSYVGGKPSSAIKSTPRISALLATLVNPPGRLFLA